MLLEKMVFKITPFTPFIVQLDLIRVSVVVDRFELSLQTSFLMCSSAHCTLGFITIYESINVKFSELPQRFTLWIIL